MRVGKLKQIPKEVIELRDLYLKVWAGEEDTKTPLQFLDAHFPYELLPLAMTWLVRNRLTGKKFLEWKADACIGSNLEMHRQLLKHAENEKMVRSIMAGKDFRV